MNKYLLSCLAGIILAFTVSLFANERGLPNLRFNLGMYDETTDEEEIEAALKLFNKYFATFFNTGGKLTGLNEFPAANMIKRRIFQEINTWTKKNQLIVYDKYSFEIEEITLLNPVTAIAISKEVWFLNIQERDTRKKVSRATANLIQVRYFLKKLNGIWKVVEFEVFGSEDDIPSLHMERLYL